MYYRGEGIARSAVKSFVWFQMALADEREAAAPFLERLRVVLSREEIASAEQAAADFEPMMTITQLTEIAPAAGPAPALSKPRRPASRGHFLDLGAARRGVLGGERRAHGDRPRRCASMGQPPPPAGEIARV